MKIISFIFDIYLLFNNNIIIIVDLQINDFFIVDIIEFMNMKSRELYVVDLIIKLCERFISEQQLKFNEFIIIFDNNIKINQIKQVKKIQLFFKSFIKKIIRRSKSSGSVYRNRIIIINRICFIIRCSSYKIHLRKR